MKEFEILTIHLYIGIRSIFSLTPSGSQTENLMDAAKRPRAP